MPTDIIYINFISINKITIYNHRSSQEKVSVTFDSTTKRKNKKNEIVYSFISMQKSLAADAFDETNKLWVKNKTEIHWNCMKNLSKKYIFNYKYVWQ